MPVQDDVDGAVALHGLSAVDEEIDEDDPEQPGIGNHWRSLTVDGDVHVLHLRIAREQLRGRGDECANLHRRWSRLRRTGEQEQVLHQFGQLVDSGDDFRGDARFRAPGRQPRRDNLNRPADARRVLDAVKARGAAAIGTPSHDSVKRARDGVIVEDLPREEVWTVQTPQGARLDVLEAAYVKGAATDWTDEASALRAAGVPVAIVEGSRENMKITRRGDEAVAEAILLARRRRATDQGT